MRFLRTKVAAVFFMLSTIQGTCTPQSPPASQAQDTFRSMLKVFVTSGYSSQCVFQKPHFSTPRLVSSSFPEAVLTMAQP